MGGSRSFRTTLKNREACPREACPRENGERGANNKFRRQYNSYQTQNSHPKYHHHPRRSTLVENPLQIHPFYAKQTQFAKRPNNHTLCINKEL